MLSFNGSMDLETFGNLDVVVFGNVMVDDSCNSKACNIYVYLNYIIVVGARPEGAT